LAESDLANDPDTAYLVLDVNQVASDSRWAARRTQEALGCLYIAKERYDVVVGGRLDEPGRLSPALLERLTEPLFSLYRDLADRLVALGEVDLGLVTRRRLIELLRGLGGRVGDPVPAQLATAVADLAADLAKLDRSQEAETASAEAAMIMSPDSAAVQDVAGDRVSLGPEVITWNPLPSAASYAATTAASAGLRIVDLAALQRAWQQRTAAWLEAERPEARRLELARMQQARIDAERREAEEFAAGRAAAERRSAERAKAEESKRLEAERRAAAEEAERLERKRRREERIEAHRLEVERRETERREAEQREAEREELERIQAQIEELERAEEQTRDQ
jgi:hypothetical protein